MEKLKDKKVKAGKIFEFGTFRITVTSGDSLIECLIDFDNRGAEWTEIERLTLAETAQLAEILAQPKPSGPVYRG